MQITKVKAHIGAIVTGIDLSEPVGAPITGPMRPARTIIS